MGRKCSRGRVSEEREGKCGQAGVSVRHAGLSGAWMAAERKNLGGGGAYSARRWVKAWHHGRMKEETPREGRTGWVAHG